MERQPRKPVLKQRWPAKAGATIGPAGRVQLRTGEDRDLRGRANVAFRLDSGNEQYEQVVKPRVLSCRNLILQSNVPPRKA
ncbi:hypothetical protein MRX96_013326 [Rhipicephalus microplus]